MKNKRTKKQEVRVATVPIFQTTDTTDMESLSKNYEHIKGWGIDADPENEPTYPMKHWTGDDHRRLNYQRPTLQPATVEVLHSNERPSLSAVFGTVAPPKGVSGALRRFAFRYSEGKWWHWLALLAADRVNVVEGIVDDIQSGKGFPNILAEKGMAADWKYNKKGLAKTAAITLIVGAAAVWLLRDGDKSKKD